MERSTYSSAETSTVGPSSLKHGLDHSTHSPQRPSKIARNCDQAATIAKEDNLGEGVEEEGDEGSMSMARESMNNLQPNRSQRYLVAIEYVGTRFYGSQKQPTFRTVVGVLEEAFEKFIGKPVSVFCSSRTDAGVHALSNVCHIDVERISKRKPGEVVYCLAISPSGILTMKSCMISIFLPLPSHSPPTCRLPRTLKMMQILVLGSACILPPHEPSVVRRAVNHFLQKSAPDVMVIDVRRVPPDFHARYKAQERIYFYRLLSGAEPISSFEKDRAWHVPEDLNLCAMQEACKVLIGRHDFSSFRASGCQADSPVRTLEELSVSESVSAPYFPSDMVMQKDNATDEKIACTSMTDDDGSCSNGSSSGVFGVRRGHHCLVIKARARSFLYHQVRLLVGVLKAVGTGDINSSDVQRILDAKNVTAAKPMAPSCGLYLGQVKYDLP